VNELLALRSFRSDVADPPQSLVARERQQLLAQAEQRSWRRHAVIAAVAIACVLGGAGALAASGVVGHGILAGPSAPAQNDTALQDLFPPYDIGHATQLAEFDGRTLFGARTAKGGYCFSATSPTDPKGEGGHCVSDAAARRLNAGKEAAFAMSGWSVGGYSPGATEVHLQGAGVDATVSVGANGWWIGVAELPTEKLMDELSGDAYVMATSIGPHDEVLASRPVIRVHADSRAHVIGFMSVD
jgi:hypothetical protein